MLTMVSLLLVGGSLGDQFGRRRLFVIGLVAFGATSILCALAPTEEFLIGARALQGIAGALLVPGSLAIVAATFSGEERGKAVGTWTAWTGIATVFGPAGGGALVGLISWRAIFWVNIPLIAATVMLTLRAVEESSDPDAFRGIDVPGVLLSAAGLAGPVFALIEQPTHGWGDPLVWLPLIAGVACFAAFVAWEARASAADARPLALPHPQLRRGERDHADRLRRASPPGSSSSASTCSRWSATRPSRRAWRRRRSRSASSSSRRAGGGSPRGPGRGCR